jgi:glycosyltransferase involved in cell wall biosynthesis
VSRLAREPTRVGTTQADSDERQRTGAGVRDEQEGATDALVSVVVPAHNEETTVAVFVERTAKAFAQIGRSWELVYVDDGSSDDTAARVEAAAEAEPRVRLVRQRRNLGLTEALNRGFREAKGEVIVFLPADLESDPQADIPLLLDKLDQGYDVVAGWRQGRRDGKRFASRLANVVCRALFGLDVHDLNWIKAFRREVTDALALRSSWHRYILVMAQNEGFRIGEVRVPYQARQTGRSKFGFSRLPVSFIDVVTLKFLLTFQRKPIIFFGAVGLAMIGAGTVLWAYLLWSYLSTHTQYRPLMLVAGIALLAGLLVILVGFLAELVVNISERVERLERRLDERR